MFKQQCYRSLNILQDFLLKTFAFYLAAREKILKHWWPMSTGVFTVHNQDIISRRV